MNEIEKKAYNIAVQAAEKLDMQIISVRLVHENKMRILRVIADKEFGITIDDAEKLTTELNNLLDQDDILDDEYYLEVSSVGAERLLDTYRERLHFKGHYVSVKTHKAVMKEIFIKGDLIDVTESNIKIKVNNKGRISELVIDNENIVEVRLALKF